MQDRCQRPSCRGCASGEPGVSLRSRIRRTRMPQGCRWPAWQPPLPAPPAHGELDPATEICKDRRAPTWAMVSADGTKLAFVRIRRSLIMSTTPLINGAAALRWHAIIQGIYWDEGHDLDPEVWEAIIKTPFPSAPVDEAWPLFAAACSRFADQLQGGQASCRRPILSWPRAAAGKRSIARRPRGFDRLCQNANNSSVAQA